MPPSTDREVFVDTSGYYALLVERDEAHAAAAAFVARMAAGRRRFVTTDYVLDEAVTLLVARGLSHLVGRLLNASLESRACTIEWSSAERFRQTAAFLERHLDHGWSFTDCMSFLVMRDRGVTSALTKDVHFKQAGFRPLLRP